MKKRMAALLLAVVISLSVLPLGAWGLAAENTPNYRVAFYPYDCYHMKDDLGRYSGYGFDLMQGVAKHLQATLTYVGYDHSAAECVELLREGELDIYTAARRTPEREEEFAFTEHPAITSVTCLNVKISNKKIKAGDYSTYEGMRIGLLERHTYNPTVLQFIKDKGFSCQVIYYDTPTELSSALVSDEVDAIADSFFRIPEDEKTIENFGETPYYIMVRKEDEALARQIDAAIDRMNLETPNWRTELFIRYYGSVERNLELTAQEIALRDSLAASGKAIRVVMNPENPPYAWMENGEAKGIAVDIFKATAEKLRFQYEFLPVTNKKEFELAIQTAEADIWIDMDTGDGDGHMSLYKLTDPYLSTSLSILRTRDNTDRIERVVMDHQTVSLREVVAATWPKAQIVEVDSLSQCVRALLSGQADAALMMSYTAQYLARQDLQNRFQAEIVPGASIQLRMGIKATDNVLFYSLWEKTLARVAEAAAAEVTQTYLDQTTTPTFLEYLFNHPMVLVSMVGGSLLTVLLFVLFIQAQRSRRKQEKIAGELAAALDKAEEATKAKQTFFSKMSHDIRTPLNVVLGMTQIAQRYMNDRPKLENALNNINQEGNYLLVMINSILDVNQLEHGTVELVTQPFNPADCLRECADILEPLSGKKDQHMTVTCDCNTKVVRGDVNRLKQILINIISNAIKYTGMGGHIDLSLSCQPGNRYVFCCKDNGIGMSEEFVSRIGQEFTRAEDSRVSKTQGTGLGMSVVKGFTELMGGQLTIHSTLGKGSVFCVELPFPEASQEEREMVLRPQTEENQAHYEGKKVLLVEDNALNAEIATELLATIGLEVDWAENGEEGVKRFRSSQTDEYFAVFMDMQMPVMDGVTATKLIRVSQRPDRDIPIFAMTANTFASDRRNCADAGMTGYIPKPVSVKDIEDALTEIKK